MQDSRILAIASSQCNFSLAGVIVSANDGRELLSGAGLSMNEAASVADCRVHDLEAHDEIGGGIEGRARLGVALSKSGTPHSLKYTNSFRQLRQQSDMALIKCVMEDATHTTYFTRPPLHSLTLFFEEPTVERDYRRTAWRARASAISSTSGGAAPASARSWSPAIFNAYFDVLVAGLTFAIVCFACFLHYPLTTAWLLYFLIASFFLTCVVWVLLRHSNSNAQQQQRAQPVQPHLAHLRPKKPQLARLYSWCRGWVPSHCLGSLLIALPMLATMANFRCDLTYVERDGEREFFLQLVYIGLVHFCNLSALNYCVKGLLATISAATIIVLYSPLVCTCSLAPVVMSVGKMNNRSSSGVTLPADGISVYDGGTSSAFEEEPCTGQFNATTLLFGEAVLNIVLLVALVWLLNRELEMSYRLSFHCSRLSARDRRKIQNLKNQADWLLHNIIPRHIAESLKKSAQYSENHRQVGIIFASLVNFNELYDESYMGGKEYLRVLNELISDFDEILDRAEFRNVEKIKTIGSTFMAAAGMNPYIRQENTHKYQHIHELTEFVFELQRSVDEFNQSLIEFDLVLRVGLNFGDVTAGVIGTTKLYYDIWGDAVNIASRMESTGVEGRLQASEKCMHVLSEWYTFQLRGSIFVKGKDNMTTYLLVGRKPDATVNAVCVPQG